MATEFRCAECHEPIDEPALYHVECCDHEHITHEDHGSGDGWNAPIHEYSDTCTDCNAELIPNGPDEDGNYGWEVL